MNHNLETIPRLYKEARPGSDYQFSLNLLKKFKALHPDVPTKSGLMVGLGETDEEILQVMRDMRAHDIDMLTIGQYLAPSTSHLPVRRYVHPDTFKMFEDRGRQDGLQPCRGGRDGALQLPRRPAGARRRRVIRRRLQCCCGWRDRPPGRRARALVVGANHAGAGGRVHRCSGCF